MASRKPKNNSDTSSGSVWTSFSDLFTTLAIIFLIMFVFSIIKLSLASFEQLQSKKEQEELLMGEIPEKVKKENQKIQNNVKDSLDQLNGYQEMVNTRAEELNHLMKNLKSHNTLVTKILSEQEKKDVILKK